MFDGTVHPKCLRLLETFTQKAYVWWNRSPQKPTFDGAIHPKSLAKVLE
jgi:hypothetical protein